MKEEKDILDFLKVNRTETPDALYFENLAKEVVKSQQPKVIPLYKKANFWISSAAAVVIGILVVTGLDNNSQQKENPLLALSEVSSMEILNYMDENIEEFELDEIASIIPEETLESVEVFEAEIVEEITPEEIIPTSITPSSIDMEEIDSEEILDYLYEEGIDLSDLDEIELI